MHLRFYHWAKGNALCLDSPCPWAWPPMSSRIKGTWGWSVCPWHGLRRCIRPHMQQSCCITYHNTNHGHVFSRSRACLWVGLGHVAWLQAAGPAQLRCMAHSGAQGSSRLGLAVLATRADVQGDRRWGQRAGSARKASFTPLFTSSPPSKQVT